MRTALLGLDIGTTSTKAVVFNCFGEELARAFSSPYRNYTPQPGWVEQDPTDLLEAVLSVVKTVTNQVGTDVQVQAICLAAQSGSLLPTDEEGNPVYPLITWMDGRTRDLVAEWRASGVQTEVRSISGWSLYPGLCLPTITWLRRYDPETFAAARHYFSVNDFIAHHLTGEFCTNPSNGGGMQLVDIHTANWSEPLCALAGITPAQLSKIQPSGSVIGEIRPEICATTGLPPGAFLINGGHDQGCAALGLGIIDPGRLLLACGTAWVFTTVRKTADMTRIPPSLDLNFHAVPERWAISQSLGGLGASMEWWLNQAWGDPEVILSRQEKFAALNGEMTDTHPSEALFFIPLTGGHDDPATTRTGGFVGLQLVHNRAHMAQAIMESSGFELRWALEGLTDAGMTIKALSMVGGAVQSPHWPRILANITALPIHLPRYDHWPALGAGILAGFGSGLFETIKEGQSFFKKPVREISPDPLKVDIYDRLFQNYKNICITMQEQNNTKDLIP